MIQHKICLVCGDDDFVLSAKPITSIPGLSYTWGLSEDQEAIFNIREGYTCGSCYSSMRVQGMANAICLVYGTKDINEFVDKANESDYHIAEINSCASLHQKLKSIKKLKYSEFADSESKEKRLRRDGIRTEDITSLNYPSNSFDLVLHSETLEHLEDPAKAIGECLRILKPGGICIFTTPIIWSRKTKKRFTENKDGGVNLVRPISFHGDSQDSYPVLYEYGSDIKDVLSNDQELYCFTNSSYAQIYPLAVLKQKSEDVQSSLASSNINKNKSIFRLGDTSDITKLKDIEEKALTSNYVKNILKKLDDIAIDGAGERMVPEFHKNNLFYSEHLQRYQAAKPLIKDKVVLDIACGSGYGTYMLAKEAKKIYGVDVSPEAVRYAKDNYDHKNITYTSGSGTNIPLDSASVDVVTTFETIEHIDDYEQFVREIKRVLKPDGLLIISTPNDSEYGEGNHFHIHEFEHEELKGLLFKYFKNQKNYFQSTWKSVMMSNEDCLKDDLPEVRSANKCSSISVDKTLYFYLLCSNRDINEEVDSNLSLGPHLSEAQDWYKEKAYIEKVDKLQAQLDQSEIIIKDLQNNFNDVLKSKKYLMATRLSKLNKAAHNPKMFINKFKQLVKSKN
ncbi:MAG TPA: class I SAM-dependent methyltransferase [Candidatus Saccharibacteria bacterium]|nr:class I SAM-dependent methyltransferase [Candidatus Saccharibacteria bacterium]